MFKIVVGKLKKEANGFIVIVAGIILSISLFSFSFADMTDKATLGGQDSSGNYSWRVDSNHHLIPGTTSQNNIGSASNQVAGIYVVTVTASGNTTVSGNLVVTGTSTFNGAATFNKSLTGVNWNEFPGGLGGANWQAVGQFTQGINWQSVPQGYNSGVNWQGADILASGFNWSDFHVLATKYGDHSGINWQAIPGS